MLDSKLPSLNLSDIEGFSDYTMNALMDVILRLLNPENSLEIGTYYGKTTTLAAAYTREHLWYIEPDEKHGQETARNVMSRTGFALDHIHWLQKCSNEVYPFNFEGTHFDFIHIDGCHTKEAVLNDLRLSIQLVTQKGIIVLDDFMSPTYPQITQAAYEFLYNHSDYILLFAGAGKGIIIHSTEYTKWHDFFLTEFLRLFKTYNDYFKCMALFKTSSIMDCPTFGMAMKYQEDLPDYNGIELIPGKTEKITLIENPKDFKYE